MGRMSSHPPKPQKRRDGEDMRGGGGISSCGRTRRRRQGRGAGDSSRRGRASSGVVVVDSAAATGGAGPRPRPRLPLALLVLVVLFHFEVHTDVAQASVPFPALSTPRRGRSGARAWVAFQPQLGSSFLNVRGGGGGGGRTGASSKDSDRVTTRRRRKKTKKTGPTTEPSSTFSSSLPQRATTTTGRKEGTRRAHSREDDDNVAAHSGHSAASTSKGRRRQQRRRHRHASKPATTIRKSLPRRADDAPQLTRRRKRKHKTKRRKGLAPHLSSTSSTSEEGRGSRARRTLNDGGGDHRGGDENEALGADPRRHPRTEVEDESSVASSLHATAGPSEKRKKKKKKKTNQRSKSTPSMPGVTTVVETDVDVPGVPAEDGRDREETSVAPDAREPALVEPARDGDGDGDADAYVDGPVAALSMPAVVRGDASDEVVIEQGVAVAEDADTIVVAEALNPLQPQESGGVDAWEDGTAGAVPESATHAATSPMATHATASDGDDHDEGKASSAYGAQEDQGDESAETVLPGISEPSAATDSLNEVAPEVSDEPSGPTEVDLEHIAGVADSESIGRPLPTDEAATFGAESDAVGDAETQNEGSADTESPPAYGTVHFSPLVSSLAGSNDESALSGVDAQPNPSHGVEHDASTPDVDLDGAQSKAESESLGEASHDAIPGSVVGAETDDTREVIHSAESMDSGTSIPNAELEEDDDDDAEEEEGDVDDDEEEEEGDGERLPAVDAHSVLADDTKTPASYESPEALTEEFVTHAVPREFSPPTDIAGTWHKPESLVQVGETSVMDVDVPVGQNEEAEDGDEDGDDASTGAHDSSPGESRIGVNEEHTQGERDAEAEVGVGSESLEEGSGDGEAAAAPSHTGPDVPGRFTEDNGQKRAESDDHDNEKSQVSLDGSVASQDSQGVSVSNENKRVSAAEESQSKLEDIQSRFESQTALFDSDAVSRAADNDSDLLVSVVTWNLAEESPSEEDAAFIRKFRRSKSKSFPGSDFVLIAGQECENIKPRRTEGHRSREFRRLMIKMLGKQFVPIAMHQLGGIQLGLFCKQELISDLEHVSVADVTCGIGNVFHNKGAIGAFVQLKAQNPPATGAGSPRRTQSLRMLFITAHMAAHVKNTEARDADFARIATELEAQAPPDFLSHLQKSDPSNRASINNGGGGSTLFDALDRVFFCGDLNYRIDVPREEAEHSLVKMNELLDAGATNEAEAIRLGLLRHDQLLSSIAEQRAFQGFAEGRIAFAPTFKYDKSTGDYDTSHKQRIPAWTDRVLFKPDGVRVVEYASVPEARHSDHRPVLATFRVSRSGRALSASDTERRRTTTKSSSRYQAD